MTAQPAVSVIVTCFNLGQYLDEAIASVLAQTYQDFEILLVDDGSTDVETQKLLRDYRRPKTEVFLRPHGGVSEARNFGLQRSRGRYLCFFDADDKLDPRYLEKMAAILDETPSVTFVSCYLRAFGDESWEWKRDHCDLVTLLSECTVLGPSLVRRSAVADVGGYDVGLGEIGDEDWDLWISLVERGHQGVVIPEVLYHYRRRPHSLSTVCEEPETELRLLRYLISKHGASYSAHLWDVLLRRERYASELLEQNERLEHDIEERLVPLVAVRSRELERLEHRLAATVASQPQVVSATPAEVHVDELREALRLAHAEAAAMRQSRSWRLTAPLRALRRMWTVRAPFVGVASGERSGDHD